VENRGPNKRVGSDGWLGMGRLTCALAEVRLEHFRRSYLVQMLQQAGAESILQHASRFNGRANQSAERAKLRRGK
jgi:hypothetical protein